MCGVVLVRSAAVVLGHVKHAAVAVGVASNVHRAGCAAPAGTPQGGGPWLS